ncbi:hypothetical protein F4054_08635 [Candidatus Poribacteria bacterium]|nr:hypothetical protein [Candidatus Poribacteria bacterium]MYK22313.1 hypothetical protein [Candidatus Poribacteria bacterium]
MTKVKVFLSFEFERDQGHYRRFFAEVAHGDSCHDIEDYSLNEPYKLHDNKWLKKAHEQISRSDIVIVVIGEDTHNAPGVKKEVTITNQKPRPIFQIRPKDSTGGAVSGAGDEIPWKWKKIDAKISKCLKK